MPLVKSSTAPTFDINQMSVLGLAAPSRGSRETCVWRITLPPGTPGTSHSVDREEIFVALTGEARATIGGQDLAITPGDALIVPAGQPFSLSNPGAEAFIALAVLPVGGQALLPGGEPFSPPWSL